MNCNILLLLLLSMAAGAVDVIGFLALGGLFAAHITGNLVVLCAHFVTGMYSTTGPLMAVPVFMIVLGFVSIMGGKMEQRGISPFVPLLIFQILLLLGSFILGQFHGPFINLDSFLAVVTGMLAVAAMATQSASVKLGMNKAPSTVAMTNNITQLTLDFTLLAGWKQGSTQDLTAARNNIKIACSCFLGFMAGCALGAALQVMFGFGALLLPIVLTIFAAIIFLLD